MSIDYGNCDFEGCWYKGNSDRLNEYAASEDVICISNAGDRTWYQGLNVWDGDTPPFRFTVCDVCWDNDTELLPQGECSWCFGQMMDKGLSINSEMYCRLCLDMDKIRDIVENCTFARNLTGATIEWDDIEWENLRDAKEDALIYRALCAGMKERGEDRASKAEQRKKKRGKNKREAVEGIRAVSPGVSSDTCKRIRKILDLEKPPESLDHLLRELVDKHDSACELAVQSVSNQKDSLVTEREVETVTLSDDPNLVGAELTALAFAYGASENSLFVAKSDLARQIIKAFPMDLIEDCDTDDARVYALAVRTLKAHTHDREHSKALYAIMRVWLGVGRELDMAWRIHAGPARPTAFEYSAYTRESMDNIEATWDEGKAKLKSDMENAYAKYNALAELLAPPFVK